MHCARLTSTTRFLASTSAPLSLSSLTRKFAAGVESGAYPPLPALNDLSAEAYATMTDQREWEVR